MRAKKPTAMLEEEHRSIQKIVAAMAVLADRLETGQRVEPTTLQDMVEFMRTFADRCHHGKEETHLFPALERKGVPVRGCPMGVLVAEHQKGRSLVKALAEAVDAYAKGDSLAAKPLLENLRGITELYPGHIWREDYLLFPLTNKVLQPQDQRELRERFEEVEEAVGPDVHSRFLQLAAKLEKETA